jgi:hypothetical protein
MFSFKLLPIVCLPKPHSVPAILCYLKTIPNRNKLELFYVNGHCLFTDVIFFFFFYYPSTHNYFSFSFFPFLHHFLCFFILVPLSHLFCPMITSGFKKTPVFMISAFIIWLKIAKFWETITHFHLDLFIWTQFAHMDFHLYQSYIEYTSPTGISNEFIKKEPTTFGRVKIFCKTSRIQK